MRLLITRPAEDAATLAQALRDLGVAVAIEPMLFVEYQDGPAVDLSGVGGLLVDTPARPLPREMRKTNAPSA